MHFFTVLYKKRYTVNNLMVSLIPLALLSFISFKKPLYGLKQAPRAWFTRFATFIHLVGFISSKSNTSLFIYHSGVHTAYLLLYVDDIVVMASSTAFLQHIISTLQAKFSMTDLGSLHHFLSISVTRSSSGLFLSQKQYALDIFSQNRHG